MSIYEITNKRPTLAQLSWVAPNATLIGDVHLADNASVWWNTVIRGDSETIRLGCNTNVQDGCVLHADPGVPLTLGDNVSVGHMAMLHGCTIGDGSLIGIKAVVLNHAVIGKECLIGANSLIPEGKVIPDRSLVVGSPGRVVRTLTDDEVAGLQRIASHYVENWQKYQQSLAEIVSAE